MLNDLMLLAGVNIPFVEAQVNIHQPTIKEISYIGEENFFMGCELLRFSKKNLFSEDQTRLAEKTDFDIVMALLQQGKLGADKSSDAAKLVLLLLFPDYDVYLRDDYIALIQSNEETSEQQELKINNANYNAFKEILVSMFCLKGKIEQEYNPKGEMAKRLADKFRRGHEKVAKQRPTEKVSILSRYVSILSVGEHKDMNQLMNYTIYQLFDEFQRFEYKMNYDIYIQAKMAGAKDLKEVDHWMKDIHNDNDKVEKLKGSQEFK